MLTINQDLIVSTKGSTTVSGETVKRPRTKHLADRIVMKENREPDFTWPWRSSHIAMAGCAAVVGGVTVGYSGSLGGHVDWILSKIFLEHELLVGSIYGGLIVLVNFEYVYNFWARFCNSEKSVATAQLRSVLRQRLSVVASPASQRMALMAV